MAWRISTLGDAVSCWAQGLRFSDNIKTFLRTEPEMYVTQFRAVYPELVELTAQIISNLRNRSPVKQVVHMSQLGDFSRNSVDFDALRKMCT